MRRVQPPGDGAGAVATIDEIDRGGDLLAIRLRGCGQAEQQIAVALAPAGRRGPDARRKLALWRYDYNNVRPHSSLGNKTPAEARRALELFDGNAPGVLAQPEINHYQPQGLSL